MKIQNFGGVGLGGVRVGVNRDVKFFWGGQVRGGGGGGEVKFL